jgi:hypothetical protein
LEENEQLQLHNLLEKMLRQLTQALPHLQIKDGFIEEIPRRTNAAALAKNIARPKRE